MDHIGQLGHVSPAPLDTQCALLGGGNPDGLALLAALGAHSRPSISLGRGSAGTTPTLTRNPCLLATASAQAGILTSRSCARFLAVHSAILSPKECLVQRGWSRLSWSLSRGLSRAASAGLGWCGPSPLAIAFFATSISEPRSAKSRCHFRCHFGG